MEMNELGRMKMTKPLLACLEEVRQYYLDDFLPKYEELFSQAVDIMKFVDGQYETLSVEEIEGKERECKSLSANFEELSRETEKREDELLFQADHGTDFLPRQSHFVRHDGRKILEYASGYLNYCKKAKEKKEKREL